MYSNKETNWPLQIKLFCLKAGLVLFGEHEKSHLRNVLSMLQVKSNLRSICSNLGQFEFFCFCGKQNIFGTFDLLFILLLLFISTLLTSPTIPSQLFQHPNPYSFYLSAYMYRISLEPPTFSFPLESCPDALPLSHGDLDASSTIF